MHFSRQQLLFSSLGALFCVLFIILTLMVRADMLRSFDFDATVRLQDEIPVRFDDIFSGFSLFARFEYTVTLLILILTFVYRKLFFGIIAFGAFGFAHVLELIGKTILSQPGPPRMFLRTTHVNDFPGLHVFTEASYPSGHSLRAVFIGILLFEAIRRTRRLPMLIKLPLYVVIITIVVVMLISRVSLGEHWSTDVIGGTFLGASFVFFSLVVVDFKFGLKNKAKTKEV